jgi:hypothetical protein
MGLFSFKPPKIDSSYIDKLFKKGDINKLLELMASDKCEFCYRRQIAGGLYTLRTNYLVDSLIRLLSHNNSNVRQCAVIALGLMREERAVESIIPLSSDEKYENSKVTIAAIHALGRIDTNLAREALVSKLKYKDSVQRKYAALTLGDKGHTEAMHQLIEMLTSHQNLDVAKALVKIGKPAIVPLLQFTEDIINGKRGYNRNVICSIAYIFEELKAKSAVSCLQRLSDIVWKTEGKSDSNDDIDIRGPLLGRHSDTVYIINCIKKIIG